MRALASAPVLGLSLNRYSDLWALASAPVLRGRSHMTSSLRGGGGFQMMTIDDEGGRGGFGQ